MENLKDLLISLLRLTRPLSNVKNLAIVVLAFYFSGAEFNLSLFFWGTVSLSLISSAIYAYNTINDVNVDKNNINKNHYIEGVKSIGINKSLCLVIFLVFIGLLIGYFVGKYFFSYLILLFLVGFVYSSENTRFKEKIFLDVIFGASLTFLLRFVAAWYIFSNNTPYLLPIIALIFGKMSGYILYKSMDRDYLISQNIKNTITYLSLNTLFVLSLVCLAITYFSVILMVFNPIYLHINILGSLPVQSLVLILLAIPPIIVIYKSAVNKIKKPNKLLRTFGFVYMLLIIVVSYWIL